ncbi:hypothetical protein BWR60_21710 [Inquilinus limosus]|uniref:Uncharacterized protein n=1 Tax=Inquilinus limosus TaxID=171674 RepID=A0A211ZI78_9PROT|nr:hypothetical protein BWR60_21710 [Inquilinus limosus]
MGGSASAQEPARCAGGIEAAVCGDGTIQADVFGSPLEIKTSTRMGGAIESLTWKGKEFINSADHGRLMQSASSFNKLGECYNPTEAGSAYDKRGKSSSELIEFSAEGNRLTSTSRPAYWRNCVRDKDRRATSARADSATPRLLQSVGGAEEFSKPSDQTFSKEVTIGFEGHPNIIAYKVTFRLPDDASFTQAVFEPLTAYMPTSTVSESFRYAPLGKANCSWPEMCRLPGAPKGHAQMLPLIFSSPDGEYAMGIYSPDVASADARSRGDFYNFISSAAVVKWNVTAIRENPSAGDHSFTEYVVIGSKEQVKDGIDFLYTRFREK